MIIKLLGELYYYTDEGYCHLTNLKRSGLVDKGGISSTTLRSSTTLIPEVFL